MNSRHPSEIKIRSELRKVLEALAKRTWVGERRLAEVIGRSHRGLWRKITKLQALGFVVTKQAKSHHKRRLVKITKAGRQHLKYKPLLATLSDRPAYNSISTYKKDIGTNGAEVDTVPYAGKALAPSIAQKARVGKRVRVDFVEAAALWDIIGLITPTLSFDGCRVPKGRTGDFIDFEGYTRTYGSIPRALQSAHRRRGLTNVWFCPATVRLVKGPDGEKHKQFVHAQCLWLDLDIPRDDRGYPLPDKIREHRLTQLLQQIELDGLQVGDIVSSGSGYHIYFKLHNEVKDAERLSMALKELARRYESFGCDTRTAHPTANLRVPMTKNIKGFGPKLECSLFWINPDLHGRLNKLSDIEKMLGYRYYNKWWRERMAGQQRKADEAFPGSYYKPGWTYEQLMERVHNGWRPQGKSWSEGDLGIIAEGIKWGIPKQSIIGWFTDPANHIHIYNRVHYLKDCKPRTLDYIEDTYQKALQRVTKHRSTRIA